MSSSSTSYSKVSPILIHGKYYQFPPNSNIYITSKCVLLNDISIDLSIFEVSPLDCSISTPSESIQHITFVGCTFNSFSIESCNTISATNCIIDTMSIGNGSVVADLVRRINSTNANVTCGDVEGSVVSESGDITAKHITGTVNTTYGDVKTTDIITTDSNHCNETSVVTSSSNSSNNKTNDKNLEHLDTLQYTTPSQEIYNTLLKKHSRDTTPISNYTTDYSKYTLYRASSTSTSIPTRAKKKRI